MLVVRSWATRAWIRKSLIISTCPFNCTAQEDLCWQVIIHLLHLCFCSQHTQWLRCWGKSQEESGIGWRSQGCHTNRSWCCWVRNAVRGCGGDVQLPWPLAHSLLVSITHSSPDRPCGLQGIQSQLTSRVLSCNMGRVPFIRLDDYGEPCDEGTIRSLHPFLIGDCHSDCSSEELTCCESQMLEKPMRGQAGFSCDPEGIHRYVFLVPVTSPWTWGEDIEMPRKFPIFFSLI